MDHHLERLLKAAADAAPLPTQAPAFARKARVLAYWRGVRAQPSWFEFPGLFRRGLGWVSVLALVTAGAALAEIKGSTPDEWSFANTVVNVTLTL
jgi:hypothetical protein